MIKYLAMGIVIIYSVTASGQTRSTSGQLPTRGDTVIIGLTNKIEVGENVAIPVAVESSDVRVSIDGRELTILPLNKPGEVTVKLIYKDSIVIRKFYSIYLPKPSMKN